MNEYLEQSGYYSPTDKKISNIIISDSDDNYLSNISDDEIILPSNDQVDELYKLPPPKKTSTIIKRKITKSHNSNTLNINNIETNLSLFDSKITKLNNIITLLLDDCEKLKKCNIELSDENKQLKSNICELSNIPEFEYTIIKDSMSDKEFTEYTLKKLEEKTKECENMKKINEILLKNKMSEIEIVTSTIDREIIKDDVNEYKEYFSRISEEIKKLLKLYNDLKNNNMELLKYKNEYEQLSIKFQTAGNIYETVVNDKLTIERKITKMKKELEYYRNRYSDLCKSNINMSDILSEMKTNISELLDKTSSCIAITIDAKLINDNHREDEKYKYSVPPSITSLGVPGPGEWKCKKCTLHNSMSSTRCKVCKSSIS